MSDLYLHLQDLQYVSTEKDQSNLIVFETNLEQIFHVFSNLYLQL